MTTPGAAGSSSPIPQPVAAPLTRAAIFLVVTINPGADNEAAVRSLCADLAALLRSIGFREPDENLSCIMGFGSAAWDRLFGEPRPAELHPFREIRAGTRHAVATPGDLLFHIRAERMDLCFELASQIMARLGDAVSAVDEVHGFRYFDSRDLLGFVDGTENPTGRGGGRRHGDRRRRFRFRRRQLCHHAEVLARSDGVERADDRERKSASSAAPNYPTSRSIKRSGQPRRTMLSTRSSRTAGRSRSSATTCRLVKPARASSAPISSATAVRRGPSSRCCKTCSSAGRRAITTAFSTSAEPSPATCSLCRLRRFWTR